MVPSLTNSRTAGPFPVDSDPLQTACCSGVHERTVAGRSLEVGQRKQGWAEPQQLTSHASVAEAVKHRHHRRHVTLVQMWVKWGTPFGLCPWVSARRPSTLSATGLHMPVLAQ